MTGGIGSDLMYRCCLYVDCSLLAMSHVKTAYAGRQAQLSCGGVKMLL